jgi:hypothetical protein
MVEENEVTAQAIDLGLSAAEAAELLKQYGPTVLDVVVMALKNGFTINFVYDMLKKFGPTVFQFVMDLFTSSKKNLAESQRLGLTQNTEGLPDYLNDKLVENLAPLLLKMLVEKLIPFVLENYGEQIMNQILEALKKSFPANTSANF